MYYSPKVSAGPQMHKKGEKQKSFKKVRFQEEKGDWIECRIIKNLNDSL